MKPIITKYLNKQQKQDILSLTNECNHFDQSHLSLPLEDGFQYYLHYHNQKLCSVLTIYFTDESICECYAFTHPTFRKKGFFHHLFYLALNELEDIDILFPMNPKNKSSMEVLKTLEADFLYSEYLMTLHLTKLPEQKPSPLITIKEEQESLSFYHKTIRLLGQCKVNIQGTHGYFYEFEILPDLRDQGFGKLCLILLLSHLQKKHIRTVTLQVSENNKPALSLYEKAGFTISDSLCYYLY